MRYIEDIYIQEQIYPDVKGDRKRFTKALKKEGYDIVCIQWYDAGEKVYVTIGCHKDIPYEIDDEITITIELRYW